MCTLPWSPLRAGAAYFTLRSEFEPYTRTVGKLETLGERELLELDRALQSGPQRFVVRYALGWVVATLAAMALGMLGVPSALEIGNAELLFAVLILAAVVFGVLAVLPSVFSSPLLEARADCQRAAARARDDGTARAELARTHGDVAQQSVLAVGVRDARGDSSGWWGSRAGARPRWRIKSCGWRWVWWRSARAARSTRV